ncbi:amidohydrolase family protein [Leptothrix discophora]|uniref:Amidohydrolase family protein n=1 Tax=Leptothrix discophora TaxID=89 RepID=A0ABT9FXS5_LEPDI|nr:amidohydrolase family protein [Leptothrix discophora]MDP4299047.1 amidohydrolase family protein [Leptothrix discophora]
MSAADPTPRPPPASPAGGWDCHVHVFDAQAPVRPGHYRPQHRTLAEIEAQAGAHGIGHLVLVQPSVYGTDNSVMLAALEAEPGRHRGVAVIDPEASDALLDRLHAAGVRGVRLNLVSPAGHAGDVASELARLAPRLRERGWHLQWYVRADDLPRLVGWQAACGLPFVLDHLAGLQAQLPASHPAWEAARSLAAQGAWVKLSGWYRLGATAPYDALHAHLQRVATMFGPRCVWGSDWPHTSFPADRLPTYRSNLAPIHDVLGDALSDAILRRHPLHLYDPGPP